MPAQCASGIPHNSRFRTSPGILALAHQTQYLESEVPGVHRYNAKANAPGGPAGPERNPKPQHYRLPTVAVSTSVHPDVHGVQRQSQCTGWTSKAGKKPKAATR